MKKISTFYPEDREELISKLNEIFKETGFTSFDYNIDNVSNFSGIIKTNLCSTKDYVSGELITYYGYSLAKSIIDFDDSLVSDKAVLKQIKQANSEGILCVYISVLVNDLISSLTNLDCKLVQGYSIFSSQMGMDQIGLGNLMPPIELSNIHAFSLYDDGKVLDCTFVIENPDYNTTLSHFDGKVPEDVTLMGWVESKETELKYISMFAQWDDMFISEWRSMHTKELKNAMLRLKTQQ